MLYRLILNFLGLSFFLFIFWRKLKEDYLYTQIFSTLFYILLGIAAGMILTHYFISAWWFWVSFFTALAGLFYGVYKFKLRVYEATEALVISLLPWLSFFYLADSINNLSWFSLGQFFFYLFLIFIYLLIQKHYKKFTWYKSGRIGLAGLTVLAFFFLTRSVIAIIFPFMLSFSGRFESLISGALSFLVFLLIFNLSRTK